MENFLTLLTYPFLTRALIVGLLVSLCAALLGVILVLKRFSMIGDGLSHVGFGALSVALALQLTPLPVALPVVVGAAFLLLQIDPASRVKGDAAIALISSTSMAIGVITISLTRGFNVDVYNYMFGSLLAMNQTDVYLSVVLSVLVLGLFGFFYRKLFAVTFDEGFARAAGINVRGYHTLIALLTAVTIVLGMRMMGTLLISSLIIFPALTSMRLFRSFRNVMFSALGVSVVCFLTGMVLSFFWNLPAGASIVMTNAVAFLLFALAGWMRQTV